MGRTLTLADGQLGTTAATVIAGATVPAGTRLDVILQNTSAVTQEVVLTFQRAGGTARTSISNESTTETIDGRTSTPVHDDSLRRAVEDLTVAVQGLGASGGIGGFG